MNEAIRKYPSDLTGLVFGRLTALYPENYDASGHTIWRCRCSCGNDCSVARTNLVAEKTRSCGCLRREKASASIKKLRPLTDLTGQRFGRLVVLREAERKSEQMWLCRCNCGNKKEIRRSSLIKGCTLSCGCYAREVAAANIRKGK